MTLQTTARRDGASNEGCNSGPTGHDFMDNSISYWTMTANRDDLAVGENTHQYACVWVYSSLILFLEASGKKLTSKCA
jgi:hypothetical protein